MRSIAVALAVAALGAACSGEQGFSHSEKDNDNEQGVGVLEVSPTELLFTDLDWEQAISQSQVVKITNVGENNLALYDVGIVDSGAAELGDEGVFYMGDFSEARLAPGVSAEYDVVATLSEYVVAHGEARIRCNDADAADFRIPLTAVPLGWKGDTGEGDDTGEGGDSGG
jgi:hypothetical protein